MRANCGRLRARAAAVQIGTAFLFRPEAKSVRPTVPRLREARDDGTAVTNLMTGRPAVARQRVMPRDRASERDRARVSACGRRTRASCAPRPRPKVG